MLVSHATFQDSKDAIYPRSEPCTRFHQQGFGGFQRIELKLLDPVEALGGLRSLHVSASIGHFGRVADDLSGVRRTMGTCFR